jgi:hypothetical protein
VKITVVQVTCDLCGKVLTDHDLASDPGFAVGGVTYELDLCADHAEDLTKKLAPFVAVGHKESRRPRGGGAGRRPAVRKSVAPDLKAVRAWAQDNGYAISGRGRIPAEVLAAYESADVAEASSSVASAPSARRGRRAATKRSGAGRSGGTDTKAVREWAKANGYKVGDRGRIPAEVIAEYNSASA